MNDMNTLYEAADADKDGRLNPEEYKVWIASMRVKQAERGEWGDTRESSEQRYYELADMVTPDQPGISLADFKVIMGLSGAKHQELKDAYLKSLAPAVSDEIKDAVNAHVEEFWRYYIETRADKYEEDKATRAKWQQDPEAKAKVMGDMNTLYEAADADKDGRLNPEEYKVWIASMRAKQAERGEWGDTRESSEQRYYELCDMVTPDQPGISLADFKVIMGVSMGKHQELKAAYEKTLVATQ